MADRSDRFAYTSPDEIVVAACATCVHSRGALTCDAFPERIPRPILAGRVRHVEPYDGDGGIQYEPTAEAVEDGTAEARGDDRRP